MAYTLEELTELKKAYAKGATYVAYQGQAVTYAKREDMEARIRLLERELGLDGGAAASARDRVIYAGRTR